MATHDPAKAAGFFADRRDEDDAVTTNGTDHNVEDPRVPDTTDTPEPPDAARPGRDFFADDRGQAAPTGGFFGGYPADPEPQFPETGRTKPAAAAVPGDDDDPPTDPTLRAPDPMFVAPPPLDDFDPFDPHAYRPQLPWYQKSSAKLALGAITAAAVAIVIAVSLLVAGRSDTGPADPDNRTPGTSSAPTTPVAPTTTPQSPAPEPPPPPPPPPPPESAPPTAATRAPAVQQGPRYTQRPRSTWTRDPDSADRTNIPVLPSRTFPNAGRN